MRSLSSALATASHGFPHFLRTPRPRCFSVAPMKCLDSNNSCPDHVKPGRLPTRGYAGDRLPTSAMPSGGRENGESRRGCAQSASVSSRRAGSLGGTRAYNQAVGGGIGLLLVPRQELARSAPAPEERFNRCFAATSGPLFAASASPSPRSRSGAPEPSRHAASSGCRRRH
jgi:hypothetical protein